MTVSSAPIPSKRLAPPLPSSGLLNLSPMNVRRLTNFKKNRRGFWSFWIFVALFTLSLFAEFIANDRPVIARYNGETLFPVFVSYDESKFGGFLAETDYRDPSIQAEINSHGWMIWPPIKFADGTHNYEVPTPVPSKPTWALSQEICRMAVPKKEVILNSDHSCNDLEWNWLGTDDQGRDVLARLIYGFRISILFGLILAGISSAIGILAGAVQGYFGGWIDLIFQRFIEIWSSLPTLYVLIILSSIIAPSFFVLLSILLLFSWVALVHVVRAEFLRARNLEYVRAARALGLTNARIM